MISFYLFYFWFFVQSQINATSPLCGLRPIDDIDGNWAARLLLLLVCNVNDTFWRGVEAGRAASGVGGAAAAAVATWLEMLISCSRFSGPQWKTGAMAMAALSPSPYPAVSLLLILPSPLPFRLLLYSTLLVLGYIYAAAAAAISLSCSLLHLHLAPSLLFRDTYLLPWQWHVANFLIDNNCDTHWQHVAVFCCSPLPLAISFAISLSIKGRPVWGLSMRRGSRAVGIRLIVFVYKRTTQFA